MATETAPTETESTETESSGFWNELEPTLLVVVGFLLFVFPEPATSTLGVGLMLLGATWWFYEWGR